MSRLTWQVACGASFPLSILHLCLETENHVFHCANLTHTHIHTCTTHTHTHTHHTHTHSPNTHTHSYMHATCTCHNMHFYVPTTLTHLHTSSTKYVHTDHTSYTHYLHTTHTTHTHLSPHHTHTYTTHSPLTHRSQIIGWRNDSVLRMLIFITDADYHIAGDGIVSLTGPILRPLLCVWEGCGIATAGVQLGFGDQGGMEFTVRVKRAAKKFQANLLFIS